MCGICGIVDSTQSQREREQLAGAMAAGMEKRGPDNQGVSSYSDITTFGHRRLSILDTSPAGNQPMTSRNGRFAIVLNGEVYNYRQIATELEKLGVSFRSRSDTEVILECIARWGVRDSLRKFIGMFAFAVWDDNDKVLTLARDRVGIKPLYYGKVDSSFMFSSQLDSFEEHPRFPGEIDRQALNTFLRFRYIPSPLSIYSGIKKLPAGCLLEFRADRGWKSKIETYWNPDEEFELAQRNMFTNAEEANTHLKQVLFESITHRMISDVPLGAFLSGGIDSSLVVAMMSEASNAPVQTFSIGFEDKIFDESGYARSVASALGTEHSELILSENDVLDIVPKLSSIFHEPFADASQIPTFLVSSFARTKVTVSLSGDGGDELFGGYTRYAYAERLRFLIDILPKRMRQLSASALDSIGQNTNRSLGKSGSIRRLSSIVQASNRKDLYRQLLYLWNHDPDIVTGPTTGPPVWHDTAAIDPRTDYLRWMMLADTKNYLQDDILVKVDRASMAASLEARVPLLDHRVIQTSWRFPTEFLTDNGKAKAPLRALLHEYLPADLIDRPKRGFGVPLASWMRGPLQPWCENLLDPSRLAAQGLLRQDKIERAWKEHLSGNIDHSAALWPVLQFQDWLESRKSKPSFSPQGPATIEA